MDGPLKLIRQNTKSVRTSTFQEAARDIAGLSDMVARDAELNRIWFAGAHDFEALKPEDRRRLGYLASICTILLWRWRLSSGLRRPRGHPTWRHWLGEQIGSANRFESGKEVLPKIRAGD